MKKTLLSLFKQTAPDRLERKEGGGCLGCFGTPFFLAGLFVTLMSLQIIPVSNAKEIPWWGWILMLFMGLIFTCVGGALIFGRKWISINSTQRRVWVAWGLLKPMKGEQYSLDNYKNIALNFVAGDSDSPDSYSVALKADNAKELALFSSGIYGTSLEQAMLISKFLHFPLEDNTSDHSVVTTPETLEEGKMPKLQEQEPDITPQPEVMQCKIISDANSLQIQIPGPAFSAKHLFGLVVPAVIIFFFGMPVLSFFTQTHTPVFVQMFFIGFFGLFFVVLPVIQTFKAMIVSKNITTVISVNEQGITIEHIALSGKKRKVIPVNEIIGIDYSTRESVISSGFKSSETGDSRYLPKGGVSSPYSNLPWWISMLQRLSRSKGIIIKSKQEIYSFGAGMPDEEVYHLYTLVRHYLKQAEKQV